MSRTPAWMSVLAAILLVACGGGGGAKGEPLAPDPVTPAERGASEIPTATEASGDGGMVSDNPYPVAASASDGGAAAPVAPTPQGNEEGARALLTQFVAPNADHTALTRSLRPTGADYRVLFDAQTASKIEAAQAKDWDSNKAVIKPRPTQTEIKLWSATGSELVKGTGNAKEFPGDYKKVAKHLGPTVLFFRFKFVEAGKDTGTAYDGLAFVNGHWVIAPKPWRAMEGKSGDADEPGPPDKPALKKKPHNGAKGGGKKR